MESIARHNVQVAELIETVEEHCAGRRALLRAIAGKLGITDEKAIEDLAQGEVGDHEKLKVPVHMRMALQAVGLGSVLADTTAVNVMEIREQGAIMVANSDEWTNIEFEVALASGAVVHVCDVGDCPGYTLESSQGSKRGQQFLMGDGGTIPNLGQKSLNLTDDGKNLSSVFQLAAVTRPLMSFGNICDEGDNITFDANTAIVRSKSGLELCKFHPNNGGLYEAKMQLRSPTGFGWPE